MAERAVLNEVFLALADPTRRAVIGRLGHGPASVSELAQPFSITLPSFMKHVRALESSGLVRTGKLGRVRTCTLDRDRLALVEDWLADQRRLREGRTDRLESSTRPHPTRPRPHPRPVIRAPRHYHLAGLDRPGQAGEVVGAAAGSGAGRPAGRPAGAARSTPV